jgi:hydrocephalus-inducing protein
VSHGLQQLKVDVSGRVVVPKFEFDADRLDYGVVSFSYPFSKTVTLTNTSHIPLSFVLRVPEDEKGEFNISPAEGKLLPHHSQEVRTSIPICL